MNLYLISISIIFAAVTGLFKYATISSANRPIVWIWWLIIINETIMFILLKNRIATFAGYNIFLLLQLLLYIYQFFRWKVISQRTAVILAITFSIVWVADHFILNGFQLLNKTSLFRFANASLLVLMAVTCVNHLIVSERKNLLFNHKFLICVAIIVYYTYRILIDALSMSSNPIPFKETARGFNTGLLILAYIIHFFAALCIPKRKQFFQDF